MPENTIAAFDNAVKVGAGGLELDIHLTKDRQLIVCHDDSAERTTNGKGRWKELGYNEIKKFDAGWNFQPEKNFPLRGKGIVIPLLSEILQRFENVFLNIDIKSIEKSAVDELVNILIKYNRFENIVIASFFSKQLTHFHSKLPQVNICTPPGPLKLFFILNKLRLNNFYSGIKKYQFLEPPVYSGGTPVATSVFISAVKKAGLKFIPWTVNDPAEMQLMRESGADGIITDDPETAVRILKQNLN